MSSSPLLQVEGIAKRFGATHALRGVSFDLRGGEVLALVGENGAGKSTLMKILSGAHHPDAGKMWLDGAVYAPASPLQARRAGVAMIYQELSLAPDLSVEDNLMLGQEHGRWGWLRRRSQRALATHALARLGHANLPLTLPVEKLPIAQRQIVEIARALAHNAKVLILDEPTSSLPRTEVEKLFQVLHRLRDQGVGIIYISHFLDEVLKLANRYTVLRDGASVGTGSMESVDEAKLVSLMVGRAVDELFPQVPHTPGETLLELQCLLVQGARAPSQLTLRRGEILGIAGLVGAGRTELLRAIAGLDAVQSGRVRIAGLPLSRSVGARIRAGVGLVSEDRKTEGLAQGLSIEDNVTLSRLSAHSTWGVLRKRSRHHRAKDLMESLQIKARTPRQPVAELSGGNQQKVALARVLHQEAEVLLLDEPTRGIDVGTKSEIYRLMGSWAAAGKGVVFVSSYLPELLAVCDRIAVVGRGSVQEIRAARDWTEESILATCVGGKLE